MTYIRTRTASHDNSCVNVKRKQNLGRNRKRWKYEMKDGIQQWVCELAQIRFIRNIKASLHAALCFCCELVELCNRQIGSTSQNNYSEQRMHIRRHKNPYGTCTIVHASVPMRHLEWIKNFRYKQLFLSLKLFRYIFIYWHDQILQDLHVVLCMLGT
jgi:hypothetical protein